MIEQQIDDDAVRSLYTSICNWGRWGERDEIGTLNYISAEKKRSAAALVENGFSLGLGRVVDTKPSPMNNIPAQHYMVAAGDMAPERGAGVCYDQIGVSPHGQAHSHLDALGHVSDNRVMFNEHPASLVTSAGAEVLDICSAVDGIVSRGVYLDIAGARGVDFLDPETPIRPDDLKRAEELSGVSIEAGDILVYHTGRHLRRETLGPQCERSADGVGQLPGLYPDCLQWVHDKQVAILASDCAHDVLPSPFAQERIPIHVGTEVYMGLMLLHNLQLAALATACQRFGRNSFMLVVAPLRLPGATASPVNPIAIF